MIEIEIDGKLLQVSEGSTIIEVADASGIYIPRFCYHKHLSIAANCRMCLVEVEKVGKPLPACATTVTSGMKIFTRSKKALEAQRAVMEFLLINHPLDCPICDQGGECELQDLSMGFGRAESNYCEPKRAVASENIGSLIETWMTRCIHCTRCVRFGDEIAGLREMGATGRGEHMEIGTYVKHFLHSEISGNIIDLCPVGALTNKPARYTGRSWEYLEHPTISAHDTVGSHLFVHSRAESAITSERTIMRAVPRECAAINETWCSDRDRFSVHGLYDASRVTKPRLKRNGSWVEVEWQRVIDEIVDRTRAIIQQGGAEQVAGLAGPQSTLEELYLFQKLLRSLGSNNVDHRLRTLDFSDQQHMPTAPTLATDWSAIENLQTIVLIGSNVRFEQPMLAHRIRKAVAAGAQVLVINPMEYAFTFDVTEQCCVHPAALAATLANLSAAVQGEAAASSDVLQRMAQRLNQGGQIGFFLGEHAMNHPHAATIRQWVTQLADHVKAGVNFLTEGANGVGAWLAGCVPHRAPFGAAVSTPGLHARAVLSDQAVRAYFLLNTEVEYDAALSAAALQALKQAGLVVCLASFASEQMLEYADFILPITPYTETAGTFVNATGAWQSFKAAVNPLGDSKPAWKVLRVLANFFELPGFDYRSTQAVQTELQAAAAQALQHGYRRPSAQVVVDKPSATSLHRLTPWPMYRSDALVRRSAPLQETLRHSDYHSIGLHPVTAARLGLQDGETVLAQQGDSQLRAPLRCDARLAPELVWLPAGLELTAGFGCAEAEITLLRE